MMDGYTKYIEEEINSTTNYSYKISWYIKPAEPCPEAEKFGPHMGCRHPIAHQHWELLLIDGTKTQMLSVWDVYVFASAGCRK